MQLEDFSKVVKDMHDSVRLKGKCGLGVGWGDSSEDQVLPRKPENLGLDV